MEVRHIEARSDVRGLIKAHGRAWRVAYEDILPADTLSGVTVEPGDEDVNQWMDGLTENHEGVLVAVEDDDVLGFLDMRWGDAETKPFVGENEADLKAIYVHPDHWGDGVGSALLERGLGLLPDDIRAVRLDVFAENDRARGFYESHGFEQTDRDDHEIAGEAYPAAIYTRGL